MRELEQGWQRSKDKIAERAGLTKGTEPRWQGAPWLPPMPRQQKFGAFANEVERLRVSYLEALRQADHLFQTLLHQVFATEPAARSAAA
jgi:hypothetical protein